MCREYLFVALDESNQMRVFRAKPVVQYIFKNYLKITDFRIFYPSNTHLLIRERTFWRVDDSLFFLRA